MKKEILMYNFSTKITMNAHQFQKKLLSLQANMLNFALQLTENHADAEDLLQDTTLKALDNCDKFVDNTSFKSWVLTIMRNIFINNYHKVFRTRTLIDRQEDLLNLDTFSETTFGSPDYCFQVQEIRNAIDNLDSELKLPFSMYVNGYKYTEIADELNLPLGTIKSRIFFARQKLQQTLTEFL
ncbi:MAG: sigma-70 family RNA polymerase sigma factor [Bacteroidales bacterium]